MKKMKKVKVIVSRILLLSLSLQSFSPLVAARVAPKKAPHTSVTKAASQHQAMQQQEMECCVMQTNMDGTKDIMIDSPDLMAFVAQIVRDAMADGSKDSWSEGLMCFCEKVLNGKKEFSPEEVSYALPELMSLMSLKMEMMRAPRLDAPGTDGAIVGPLLECNFDEVLRVLNKIFQFLKECCAEIEFNFEATFTILNDIKNTLTIDFSGTFTELNEIFNTLTTCCAAIESDFSGVFTVLEDLEVTVTVDFSGTFSVLEDIRVTLTTCCENIENNFNGTFTVLEDIRVTLTACCDAIENNFNGTFTVLEDIRVTLTTCCGSIENNFNGTFTAIASITTPTITVECDFSALFTVLEDIRITITECCENFNGTFTAIAALQTPCSVIPITQALVNTGGGFTINTSGNYALQEDIISTFNPAITINASNVTLDLCGRNLEGSAAGTGILINPGLFSIIIKNGHITAFDDQAIFVSQGVFNLTLEDINVDNCGTEGILLLGTTANLIRESLIKNCRIALCGGNSDSVGGLVLINCDTIDVQGGDFNRNGVGEITVSIAGILLDTCTNCNISGASMNENVAEVAFGIQILNGANNIVSSCVANQNLGVPILAVDVLPPVPSQVIGFSAQGGSNNNFNNCTAHMNSAAAAFGFALGAGETLSSIVGCVAESNIGTFPFQQPNAIFGAGIFIDGADGASFNEVQNNLVVRNNQSGIVDTFITFTVDITGAAFVVTGSSTTLVANNSAVDNGLSGPAFSTLTPFRNYTVAYPTTLPVQFVSFRYSTGLPPVVSSAGNTILSNIDTRFGV